MVGFKAEPGICDRVPSFITETYKKNPSPNGRGGAWTEPASAVAQIPVHCDRYPRNIGRVRKSTMCSCHTQGTHQGHTQGTHQGHTQGPHIDYPQGPHLGHIQGQDRAHPPHT